MLPFAKANRLRHRRIWVVRRSVTIKGKMFVGPRGGSPRLAEWTYVRLVNRLDRVIWMNHGTEVPATITVSWETPAPRKRTTGKKGGKRG